MPTPNNFTTTGYGKIYGKLGKSVARGVYVLIGHISIGSGDGVFLGMFES